MQKKYRLILTSALITLAFWFAASWLIGKDMLTLYKECSAQGSKCIDISNIYAGVFHSFGRYAGISNQISMYAGIVVFGLLTLYFSYKYRNLPNYYLFLTPIVFSSIWMYSFQINTLIFAFVSIGILIYLKDNAGKIDNVALVACAVCLLAIYFYIPRNFIYDSSVQFFGRNLRIFEIFPFAEDLYRLTVVVATLLILSKVETARRRLG